MKLPGRDAEAGLFLNWYYFLKDAVMHNYLTPNFLLHNDSGQRLGQPSVGYGG